MMVRTAQIRGVIRLKVAITIVLAVVLLLILGQSAAIASGVGGLIAIFGSVLYAVIAYGSIGGVKFAPAAEIMRRHFAAEMAKLCMTLLAFAALFVLYRQADWLWVFVGYLAAASAYWFGLLIQFDGKK
ncbi:ATP synthase subunit I [Chitinibacter bivalviorum]|uniref:ATP synthase subunit I n=1 Tax=Chitinibacter bivalviorum TaxID=2739434 RepID=A0A7H9BML6_9NEIS|nr:ATP synthase subunit I [Chitinibacter bivalviorum]QLG89331.1 ATP synthase subunit I [Chitinibacter bivalviorum]